MQNLKTLTIVTIALLWLATPSAASPFDRVGERLDHRREIKSMHLYERPSRRGHFYGNAVRQRHGDGKRFIYGGRFTQYVL